MAVVLGLPAALGSIEQRLDHLQQSVSGIVAGQNAGTEEPAVCNRCAQRRSAGWLRLLWSRVRQERPTR
jgi:hypothetical protein